MSCQTIPPEKSINEQEVNADIQRVIPIQYFSTCQEALLLGLKTLDIDNTLSSNQEILLHTTTIEEKKNEVEDQKVEPKTKELTPEEVKPEEAKVSIEEVVEDGRINVTFKVSFYTSLACENTSYGAVDAMGNKLEFGTIAVPKDVPLKSKIYIEDYEFTARDRGSKVKWADSNTMKVDVFIPRKEGESDDAYYKRVNNMGIKTVKGYYIPYKEK